MSTTFQKTILFTVSSYIERQVKEECYEREFLMRVLSSLLGYQMFHKFSPEEAKRVAAIGEHEAIQKLKVIEIDYSIYSIQLLFLYITEIPKKQRAYLNISDSKIKMLRANLVKDMLRLKGRDDESYQRTKEIVQQSQLTAKKYFFYMMEELK